MSRTLDVAMQHEPCGKFSHSLSACGSHVQVLSKFYAQVADINSEIEHVRD